MSSIQAIAVNPSLLAWARAKSGYALDRVAKRLNVKVERVAAWESGERQPTLRQVENLARFLHRPLSVFFMPRPPQLTPLAMEYRRLPDVEPGHETPELRLALRQMLARRENALNLMEELGEAIPEFSVHAHLRESPVEVGQRLRRAMGVDLATQLGWDDQYEAWREWRAAVERLGILGGGNGVGPVLFTFPPILALRLSPVIAPISRSSAPTLKWCRHGGIAGMRCNRGSVLRRWVPSSPPAPPMDSHIADGLFVQALAGHGRWETLFTADPTTAAWVASSE